MGDEKNTLKHIHFNAHLHICFVSLLYTSLGALIGLNLAGQLWLGERKQQQYQLAELSRAEPLEPEGECQRLNLLLSQFLRDVASSQSRLAAKRNEPTTRIVRDNEMQ